MTKQFLTKTRWLVTILLLFTFAVPHAWAEKIELTQSVLNITATAYASSSGSKTVDDVDFSWDKIIKNNSNMQLQASNGEIWNTSVVPGKITNVSITHTGTARNSTLYWGTAAKTTDNSTTISGSSSNNTPANSCFGYIHVKRSTSAAYWTKMEITYTPASFATSTASISSLNYNVGSGPSAAQSFTVTGSNIPARLKITAPTDFEVKVGSSGSWGSEAYISVTLTGSAQAGTLTAVDGSTVYVRLKSGKSAGNYSGNVSVAIENCNSVTGVTPKTVAVSGTVSAASCSTKPELNGAANNGTVSSSSIPVKCTGITSIGANCSLTSYGFVWAPTATTTEPTLNNSNHEVGTSIATSTEFSYTITGLNASTSYTIRSYATNGNGTQYGSAYTVTTLAACTAAPTVGAGSSSNVTKNTATVTCSAGITSLGTGGCAIESYGFVYGTSQNPTTSNNKVEVGTTYTTTGTSFNANLTGLAEGQTYYVRPYATNGNGTAYGTQTLFGTPKITVNPSTQMLKFGGRKVGGSYTMTFTVSGVNLQGNITLTPSSGCTGLFSIDKNSITPDGSGSVTNEVITVTYTPTTAGSHGNVNTIYINITSTNATTKNMAPSGIGQWEVTWTANGVSDTTLVSDNTKPTFPATPAACDATSTTFIGWSTAPWSGKLANLTGKTVHTSYSTMSNITANGTEFYAVWAKGTGGGSAYYSKVTSTGDISNDGKYLIVYEASTTSAIMLDGSRNELDGTPDTIMGKISSGKIIATDHISASEFSIDMTNLYIKSASNKYINYSSATYGNGLSSLTTTSSAELHGISIDASENFVVYGSCHDSNNPANYVQLKYNTQAAGGNTNGSRFRFYKHSSTNVESIQLYKYHTGVTFSDYLTTCCENIVPAPEVTGTSTKNSITLSWTNVTGANGYTVTCSGGTPGEVTSSGTSRTCEITGLSPNTAYTWTVVATYDSPYCQATAANGSTTTKQVYTVSYNKNGGTIANLPSGGSYAEGETVNVAAKPDGNVSKSGYEFTGWNTAATPSGSSTHYDADGTATFTMPASPVTLYAEWTPKKYYYVDRMHGNGDGVHTKVIGGVTYDCYVGEAQHTTPNPADNSSGTNSCVTGHSRFIGWVLSTSIGAQGQLLSGYTIIAGGIQTTAGVDGRIYYAVWAEE